jgi:hypothetical protein
MNAAPAAATRLLWFGHTMGHRIQRSRFPRVWRSSSMMGHLIRLDISAGCYEPKNLCRHLLICAFVSAIVLPLLFPLKRPLLSPAVTVNHETKTIGLSEGLRGLFVSGRVVRSNLRHIACKNVTVATGE